jgi:3-oxoadipate enol-lactonase
VIAGREDPATSIEMAEALRAGIVGSRLVVLTPAAHLLAIEQAEQVTAELRRDLSVSFPQKSQS